MSEQYHRRTPSLTSLRAFEAAARHSSFVKAGAELNVTPAAISHRVKALEEQLGVALFERKTRGVALTDAGRRYREQIAAAFHIIERATADIDQTSIDGPLMLSTPSSFANFWLLPRLPGLAARFPGLELTVEGENRPVDLRSGQADIGIRFGTGRYRDLHAEFLFGDAVTVLAPSSSLTGLSDTRPRTLLQKSILLEDYQIASGEPWMGWEPWLREVGVHDHRSLRRLRFSDAGLVVRASLASVGACIARISLVREFLRQRRLSPLFPWRSTEFAYYFVTRPADRENPRINAFRAWLTGEIDAYLEEIHRTFGLALTRPEK